MIVFDPDMHLKNIVIVGLGGTGSQLSRSVSRMLYDMRSRNLTIPHLTFVDPDRVEAKNVGRQMFTVADIGQYKAECLARRFNRALGLDITWYNEAFDPNKNTESYYSRPQHLLCGAVDNHEARRALAAADGVWLDCGNHFSSGQVVIGTTDEALLIQNALAHLNKENQLRVLPNAALVFPQLLEPEETRQPELSCAELVELGEQHLLINDLVATVAAQYVFKLLHRQPITSFLTYVDLDGLTMRSVPITSEDIRAYVPMG